MFTAICLDNFNLGNLQGQYSKMFSSVILSIILQKSTYDTKFLQC